MSTLDKLRAIAEKRKRVIQDDDSYFKPDYGESVVRFLPAKNEDNPFIKEYGEHWVEVEIDGESRKKRYICPKHTAGKKCPICEAVSELYNAGDDESVALARQLKVRKQHYANVIVRGEEEKGPRIFKFGIKLANRIIDDCLDEEVDISDPESGIDYRVIKKKDGDFPSYDSSKLARKQTSVDEDDFAAWMDAASNVHKWVDDQLLTYEEIEAEFSGVEVEDTTKGIETQAFDEDALLSKIEDEVA